MASLEQVLMNTYRKEEYIRKEAERALDEACGVQGYTVQLLRIACEAQLSKEVRQAAGIALKNGIKRNWSTEEQELENEGLRKQGGERIYGRFTIPKQDRDVVRANILAGLSMIHSDSESIRNILSECVGLMASTDFPTYWPDLTLHLTQMLQRVDDAEVIHNGLLALRRVVKTFEYKRTPRRSRIEADLRLNPNKPVQNPRAPLNELVLCTFPFLLEFAQRFVDMNDDNSARMLRIIGKTFYSATRLELPPYFHSNQVASQWFLGVWNRVIQKPLTFVQSQGDDLDDLSLRPWLKAKKNALEIAVRIFQECVKDPQYLGDDDNDSDKQFTLFFIDQGVASSYLHSVLELLNGYAETPPRPLPSRILQLCLSYCTISMEPSKTYKVLRPQFPALLQNLILNVLSFSKEDALEWIDEPESYDVDPLDGVFDPKATACELLLTACRVRSKDLLDGIVTYLVEEMGRRTSASRQDACLYAVGALSEALAPVPYMDAFGHRRNPAKKANSKRIEKYRAHLEQMVSRFVVPELQAEEAHLRARACWVVGRYAHVDWKDTMIVGRTFGGLLDRLGDKELPVQAQACASLKNVLILDPEESLASKATRELAANHLPLIIQTYLFVMSRMGTDDIVASLQSLIMAFQVQVVPIAADVCQALVQAFFHYMNSEEEDEDGERASAAFETLEAIRALVECVATGVSDEHMQVMARVEQVLLPLMDCVISPNAPVVDFLETVVSTFAFFTYYSPTPLSNELWSYIGRIKQCFDDHAFDYLQEFIVPLEHLAYRETERFFVQTDMTIVSPKTKQPTNQTYAQACTEMCMKVLKDEEGTEGSSDVDIRAAGALLCAILQACPRADLVPIPQCCQRASFWLFHQEVLELCCSTRVKLFEIVESCFYLDAYTTRQEFGSNLEIGLTTLRGLLQYHKTIRKKKIGVLGLSSLLRALTRENDVSCTMLTLGQCLELIQNIEKQKEFEAQGGSEYDDEWEEEEDEEDQEEDEEVDEEKNAHDDHERAYENFLKLEISNGFAGEIDGEDIEEEDPDDYPWPLDSIDERVHFQESVVLLAQNNPQLLRAATGLLHQEIQALLVQCVPQLATF